MSNDDAIKQELGRLPPEYRSGVLLALSGRQEVRAHIAAYCVMCKRGSKHEISVCADAVCPLRHARPFQPKPTNHQGKQQ